MKKQLDFIVSQVLDGERLIGDQTTLGDPETLYDSFTTLEEYPLDKLIILHTYLTDLSIDFADDSGTSKGISKSIASELRKLETILNLPDSIPSTTIGNKLVFINAYGYTTVHCKGRMYGVVRVTPDISRQSRYYLFKDMYFDLDLKNAHPSMLLDYADKHHIKAEELRNYVHNREAFLEKVSIDEKLTRSEAKRAVLICINLEPGINYRESLKGFHDEIIPIREHIFNANIGETLTDLGKYVVSRKKYTDKRLEEKKISCQAIYCQSLESQCLQVLYEVCVHKAQLERDVTLDKNVRNISFIPFFDGAFVNISGQLHKSEIGQILEDTNKILYPLVFEAKTISSNWTYMNEQDLAYYEKIDTLLANCSQRKFQKLLDYLKIPQFSLDESKLDDIISSISSSDEKELVKKGEHIELLKFVDESSKMYKYRLRRALLSQLKQNRYPELLGIIAD